ncbi:type VI secretion system ImpA family N-terminal domain-containing protein [Vibrio metschnikovii]|uniref:Type VI secretion system ImpA family N-terminal domain-containing protein n=1 Tax=Vibrio metschnikovii TaxID=28172 RepID=A0A9X0R6T5_VIBME|nr:type VI secretion system ImpA family N-terminal domain-containing protein [Vibrio metschnikovii]MBC5850642.1 type VI secretion system ImpA family N-terminal domain-containing protein [Vibrio metschnikovii]
MSIFVFTDQVRFHLIDDASGIRNIDLYQKIRDEINRRNNPLSGGTDWSLVKDACEILAKGPGIDLLLCGYYTVACLKIQGLVGYANGLELLNSCLSNLSEPDIKSAKMRKEVLDWVNARVVRELKDLYPNYESLRDLYRCERFLERIYAILESQQPDNLVDFDGVGFAIFEHIDRLETQYQSLLKRHEQTDLVVQEKYRKRSYVMYAIYFSIGVLISALLYGLVAYLPDLQAQSYAQSRLMPILNSSEKVMLFEQENSPAKINQLSIDIIPLYRQVIEENMDLPFGAARVEARALLDTLLRVYPNVDTVIEIEQQFSATKQEALRQTERFIEQFSETRTKMANISLLAQQGRLSELQRKTKSLEDFAVSLSPIYGRVAYVEDLIKKGQITQASEEFMILKYRLNNLTWKIAELEQKFQMIE